MIADVLSNKVLILNSNWMPINITTVYQVIKKEIGGRALLLSDDLVMHTWDDWVDNWSDAIDAAKQNEHQYIRSKHMKVLAPEIAIMKYCKRYKLHQPELTRANIFIRDDKTCQYCGRKFKSEDLTFDHILPQSRGGKTTWENIVLACNRCNIRKANRTPEEANMRLLRKPTVPAKTPFGGKLIQNPPKSWEDFLGKIYWQISLNE